MKHLETRISMAVPSVLLSLVLSACSGEAPPTQKQAAESEPKAVEASAKATIGSFGFDEAGMDRSVKPGQDFFQFANGNWRKNAVIPDDRSSFSAFSNLRDQAEKDVKKILEQAMADASADGDTRKIGDFYAAFMDEAAIEAKGMDPVRGELVAINAIADKDELSRALGASLRADVDLLNATDTYTDRLFGVWVTTNLLNPQETIPYLVQGGLGMPDRDFYLEGGRMEEMRAQYRTHVAKVLQLAEFANAEEMASAVMALETAIAKVHATQLDTNDVKKGANAWSRDMLQGKAPGINWGLFLDAAGLAKQEQFIVWQPGAVTGISAAVAEFPLETWKHYLVFHAIERASPQLSRAFVDEHFAFNGRTLSGTPQLRERWKRAASFTEEALGEAIGRIYVGEHFTPETKARADEMVRHIIAAFGQRIDSAAWMSAETKSRAKAKLGTLTVGIGYPDRWRDYSGLEVQRDDALGNVERAQLFEYRRALGKLGQPVDRSEWFMVPQLVNALNVPLENRLIFPAAILQPPFFDAAADSAINYGGIGAVIGHEISHSFDNNGALFDETGKLEDWWTKQDFERFEAAGAALAAQYDQYKPFPDLAVNGKLTLGENIADVAGLASAFDGYQNAMAGKDPATLDGFTAQQRFFLGWAQVWRSVYREQTLRNIVLTNGHAPGQYRAMTVRNIDPWYAAFDVQPGQESYLSPEQRVRVW